MNVCHAYRAESSDDIPVHGDAAVVILLRHVKHRIQHVLAARIASAKLIARSHPTLDLSVQELVNPRHQCRHPAPDALEVGSRYRRKQVGDVRRHHQRHRFPHVVVKLLHRGLTELVVGEDGAPQQPHQRRERGAANAHRRVAGRRLRHVRQEAADRVASQRQRLLERPRR